MDIIEYAAPSPIQQASIFALARRAESHDGVSPLNEDATLAITHGSGRHLLARDCDQLLGYAYASDADSAAQIVVDPVHRRRGTATQLIAHVACHDLWAFGDGEPARAFCAARGYTPVRGLLVMELGSTPEKEFGVAAAASRPKPDSAFRMTISAFVPLDLEDLVRLNARAFADHPEQGRMTTEDFLERMESKWFDPEGLLIARDEHGQMIGFHWTKAENGIGEVYVLGVDPDHAGAGVGSRLLQAGLAYLRSRNVDTIRLWVDDDNHNAQSLYKKSGFSPIRHDIRYRRAGEIRRVG